MIDAGFNAFACDLDDEGLEPALARLAGDLSVTTVCVAALHPAAAYRRCRPVYASRRVVLDAGASFAPEARRYAAARFRPRVGAGCRGRNPLEAIARACERASVGLRVRVSACIGGTHDPQPAWAACATAHGDVIDEALCPAHPSVREFLAALVEDLSTNYPIQAIELQACDYGPLVRAVEASPAAGLPTTVDRALCGWCFCSACRQRADDEGVDASAVAALVARRLDASCHGDAPQGETLSDWLAGDAGAAAYARLRADSVQALIRSIRARSRCPVWLELPPRADRAAAGITESPDAAEGFVTSVGATAPDTWREDVRRLAFEGLDAARLALTWPACPPGVADAPTLVRAVREAAQAGYRRIAFDHYGQLPETCFDWVRQAVRFARRDGGD